MIDTLTTVEKENRALRAVVLAFALLAQLLLPAVVLRAEAGDGGLCVTRANSAGSHDSKSHAHDLQCSHCSLHHSSSYVPPSLQVVASAMVQSDAAVQCISADLCAPLRRAQPPPTGPPTL